MKTLHLFDLYLPQTMNWAWAQIRATPGVEHGVAAPWMLKNDYSSPDIRFFARPLQTATGWFPHQEGQGEWFSTNLIRAEKYWPTYRQWLCGQLKKHRPDVLHAHFAPVGCHFLPMAQQLGIPLVTSFYGFDFRRLPTEKNVYRARYQQLFRYGAAMTTTGELTPAYLEKQGCLPEKIVPIPLSIRPEAFPLLPRTKPAEQLRLVQVATITEKKGHLDTLAAFKIALRHCPNARLTLAGERQDKNLFRQLQNFIQTNDLQAFVTVLDALPHADLPVFFGRFDAFIHPSRTAQNGDCEGAPAVILEAQATGLPVISTTHSDIPRQVLHGKTGFLAPERQPERLAEHIGHLYRMGNPEFQAMSQAAHEHVVQQFDVSHTGQVLRDLYQKILSEP